MIHNEFGQLGERVSAIGFGAASLSGRGGGYGFGAIDDQSATDLVHGAIDLGVNLFDTAPIYGFGESERRLGLALSGRRDGQLVVSKCGVAFDDNQNVRIDNSASTTRAMLEDSLRRLQVDVIDAYLVHWPDPNIDIRETMEVLVRAKESGLIRYVGLSNTSAEELSKAREVGSVDIVQLESSFLVPGRLDELESSEDLEQMGVMSWGTLAKGILTGRVTRDRTYDPLDVRHSAPWWVNADHEPAFKIMDRLGPVLEEIGHSGLELALGYLMNRGVVDTLLCGVRTSHQLSSAVEALGNLPSEQVITECLAIRDRVWHECGT
ncbi:MAG: aldo/keto reductase [Bradymonadia bacterium]